MIDSLMTVINANSVANKKAELAAIAEYCDPALMLISETKLGPDILNGEFVPEGYMGRFRKDRKRGAGGVMIITKECYKIVDADITVGFVKISYRIFLSLTSQRYSACSRPRNGIGTNFGKVQKQP